MGHLINPISLRLRKYGVWQVSWNTFLKKDYIYYFRKIYLFFIKNFNYRQYCLYQKIMELVNPSIYYFVHHQSFMPKFLKKKRIKRRVLKTLKKQ